MTTHTIMPQVITLIGMPTVGKTKVGKLLAELLGYQFVDIDDSIVTDQDASSLSEIVQSLSREQFIELEGAVALRTLAGLQKPTIIATGGSMIYNEAAMVALSSKTYIVHLEASLPTIARRVAKRPDRGIVFAPGETLTELYMRRMPLYRKWAHDSVNCDGKRKRAARKLAARFAEQIA